MTATTGNHREPPLLTTADACTRLRVSEKTLRRMIAAGEIAAIKVGGGRWGGSYRITEEALADYLKRNAVEAS